MKSKKFRKKTKKKVSGKSRFNKEQGTYDFTVSLIPDQYEFVCRDSACLGTDPEMYVTFMVYSMIRDLKAIGDEQELVHGVRFAHPEDCDCCGGESLKDLEFVKNFKVH